MRHLLILSAIAVVSATAQYVRYIPMTSGSGFCPSGFPSSPVSTGLQAWYSADCITFPSSVCATPSNGASVTSWADRSGNSRNGTLSTGSATFNTAQINSLPAVTLNSSAMFNMGGTSITSNNLHTAFMVFSRNATGSIWKSSLFQFLYQINASQKQEVDSQGNSNLGVSATSVTASVWHKTTVQLTGTTSAPGFTLLYRLDGAADSTVSPSAGSSNVTPPTSFGYDQGSGNKIAELLYYNVQLSSSDITSNECYIYGKYGI